MVEESRFVLKEVLTILLDANDKLHADVLGGDSPDPAKYVRDFRTIRLDAGQRMGKSRAMLSMADANDLIIVPSSDDAIAYGAETKATVIPLSYVLKPERLSAISSRRWARVWIEPASRMLSQDQLTWLLVELVKDDDQQFILLG